MSDFDEMDMDIGDLAAMSPQNLNHHSIMMEALEVLQEPEISSFYISPVSTTNHSLADSLSQDQGSTGGLNATSHLSVVQNLASQFPFLHGDGSNLSAPSDTAVKGSKAGIADTHSDAQQAEEHNDDQTPSRMNKDKSATSSPTSSQKKCDSKKKGRRASGKSKGRARLTYHSDADDEEDEVTRGFVQQSDNGDNMEEADQPQEEVKYIPQIGEEFPLIDNSFVVTDDGARRSCRKRQQVQAFDPTPEKKERKPRKPREEREGEEQESHEELETDSKRKKVSSASKTKEAAEDPNLVDLLTSLPLTSLARSRAQKWVDKSQELVEELRALERAPDLCDENFELDVLAQKILAIARENPPEQLVIIAPPKVEVPAAPAADSAVVDIDLEGADSAAPSPSLASPSASAGVSPSYLEVFAAALQVFAGRVAHGKSDDLPALAMRVTEGVKQALLVPLTATENAVPVPYLDLLTQYTSPPLLEETLKLICARTPHGYKPKHFSAHRNNFWYCVWRWEMNAGVGLLGGAGGILGGVAVLDVLGLAEAAERYKGLTREMKSVRARYGRAISVLFRVVEALASEGVEVPQPDEGTTTEPISSDAVNPSAAAGLPVALEKKVEDLESKFYQLAGEIQKYQVRRLEALKKKKDKQDREQQQRTARLEKELAKAANNPAAAPASLDKSVLKQQSFFKAFLVKKSDAEGAAGVSGMEGGYGYNNGLAGASEGASGVIDLAMEEDRIESFMAKIRPTAEDLVHNPPSPLVPRVRFRCRKPRFLDIAVPVTVTIQNTPPSALEGEKAHIGTMDEVMEVVNAPEEGGIPTVSPIPPPNFNLLNTQKDNSYVEMRIKKFRNRRVTLSFHTDVRPAYTGTFSRRSRVISGRRPLARDRDVLDYDYDSEASYVEGGEEEGDGESILTSDDEAEGINLPGGMSNTAGGANNAATADELEYDNFFVRDGDALSDIDGEEGCGAGTAGVAIGEEVEIGVCFISRIHEDVYVWRPVWAQEKMCVQRASMALDGVVDEDVAKLMQLTAYVH
eukprot:gene23232-28218_t